MVRGQMEVPRAVLQAWQSLESGESVQLPWEKGVWSRIFDDDSNRHLSLDSCLKRPFPLASHASSSSVADLGPAVKVSRQAPVSEHWTSVVANTDPTTWDELLEAKWEVALKRWFSMLSSFPADIGVTAQLGEIPDWGRQMGMLRDIFAGRSPLTVLKRANSLQRYVTFLHSSRIPFPGSEKALYDFLVEQRLNGAPSSRLQAVIEALRFVQHVVGIDEVQGLTSSKRCVGATRHSKPGHRRQASPFTVNELETLHSILMCAEACCWDRLLCGAALCAVYSRSRWNDIQHADNMLVDCDEYQVHFLEFQIVAHKTRRSDLWKEAFLPAVGPAKGVIEEEWVTPWLAVRKELGICITDGFPMMPAPGFDELPTKRPLSTEEFGKWLRMLLVRHGHSLEGRKLSSHSCKATMLSYLAKWGASITDREILGGHASHVKTVLCYSRDGLAKPLMTLGAGNEPDSL